MSESPHKPLDHFPRYKELPDDAKCIVVYNACQADHPGALDLVDRTTQRFVNSYRLSEGQGLEAARNGDVVPFFRSHSKGKIADMIRNIDGGAGKDSLHLQSGPHRRLHIKEATIFHPHKGKFFLDDEIEFSESRFEEFKNAECLHQDVFLELMATLTEPGHRLDSLEIIRFSSGRQGAEQRFLDSFFVPRALWTYLDCQKGLERFAFYGHTPSLPRLEPEDIKPKVPSAFSTLESLTFEEQQPGGAFQVLAHVLPFCKRLTSLTIGIHAPSVDTIQPTPALCLADRLTKLNLARLPSGRAFTKQNESVFGVVPYVQFLSHLFIKPCHLSSFVKSQTQALSPKSSSFNLSPPPSARHNLEHLQLHSFHEDEEPSQEELTSFQGALDSLMTFEIAVHPQDSITSDFISTLLPEKHIRDTPKIFVLTDDFPDYVDKADDWEDHSPYLFAMHEWCFKRHSDFAKQHTAAFEASKEQRVLEGKGHILQFAMYAFLLMPSIQVAVTGAGGSFLGSLALIYQKEPRKAGASFDAFIEAKKKEWGGDSWGLIMFFK